MKKLLISTCVIFLAIFAFFFSNIKGYYRFKQYCEAEGGLRVYEPLERNVGWLAKDKYDAQVVAQFKGVGIARFVDKQDGIAYDLRYMGGNPQRESSFIRVPADETKTLRYRWNRISLQYPSNVGKFGYEIFDVKSEKMMVSYYMFGYSKFKFLGRSAGVQCHNEIDQSLNKNSLWFEKISTAFKN